MRDVLDEVADVFGFEFVHIGGDEVPPDEWDASADAVRRITAEGLSGPAALAGWWSRELAAHLARLGRRAGVWDEVMEQGVPDGAAIFAWQAVDRVELAVSTGHDVVAAPVEHTYLDWREAASPDEPPAIAGDLPLENVFGYDPPGEVLGVQGQLWSEYLTTPELVEWRAFPRLTAIAEVGWCTGTRDFVEFRQRLTRHLHRLDRMGVNYRPLST
jgi:hexosaminidase